MNRIYSKVWNPKLGQLVVASELASRDGMGAAGAGHVRARGRGALALAVLMALGGLSGSAFALDAVCVDPNDLGTTVGDASASGDQVACGQGAVAVGTNAIAVGANARSSGTAAMAIGVDAQAIAIRATALGYNSVARAQDSLAIGGATANAQRSIAMGQNAVAGLSSTGTANMVAIGAGATARAAASVALGSGASTGSDDGGGSYAIAIGGNSQAVANGGVAIGYNARALSPVENLNLLIGSVAIGRDAMTSGTYATALGDSAQATGNHSMAMGHRAGATQEDATAYGHGARAEGLGSLAVGGAGGGGFSAVGARAVGENSVAIGSVSLAQGESSIALGDRARATGIHSLSMGNRNVVAGNRSGALGELNNIGGNDSYAVGNNNVVHADTSEAFILGNNVNLGAGVNRAVALGHGTGVTVAGGVALGAMSVASVAGGAEGLIPLGASASDIAAIQATNSTVLGAVSVGTGAAGGNRQIVNVAAGTNDSDAVNVAQLKAVSGLATAGWDVTDANGNTANIGPGGEVRFESGNTNLTVTQTGDDDEGVVQVTLGNDLNLTAAGSVTTGQTVLSNTGVAVGANVVLGNTGLVIAGGPSVTATGINAGGQAITGVLAGVNGTDAVNVNQLNSTVGTALSSATWDVKDANGNTANIGPGGEVRFESGNANLTVTQTGNDDEGVVQVTLGNDLNLTAAGSVTTGQTVVSNTGVSVGANVALGTSGLVIAGGPSVTTTGINAGDATITGVLAGVNGTDAVNVNQLNSTVGTALSSATWNVKDANGNTANIGPGGEVRFESGNTNLTVTQTGDDDEGVVEITLGNDLNLTAAGSVTTGQTVMNNSGVAVGANVVLGTSGLTVAGGPVTTAVTGSGLTTGTVVVSGANNSVTGLSNTTLAVPGFAAAGRAATEEQLQLVRGEIGAGIEANKTKYYSVNSTGGGNEDNDGANGTDAIAAGKDAAADGDGSVALGLGASASGDRGVALGAGAQALSFDSLAIGSGAMAGHANSIALGAGSATTVGARASYQGAFVGNSSSTGEMNVGGRQVTGVAAGSAATDAVNVSQLQAGVDHAITEAKDYTDSQMGNLNAGLSDLDNRVGAVEGDLIDIRGDITQIQGDIVDIQGDITNLDQRVSQIGDSMGDLASTVNGFESRVTELENRGTGPVRVTQGETYEVPVVSGTNALGGGNGAVASGDNSVALGNQAVASANNSTAIGQGAVASHGNSVALGQGSATTIGAQAGYNAAYVGRSNSTGEVNVGGRTLSGVAPGIAGTDAVNVNQLTAGVSHAIDQANQYTENRLNQMQGDVWSVNRSYRGATASAMAMAGIPQAYVPGKSMLAVGFGGYQSEYGMAVGLSGITVDGRWVYKAQASGNTSRDWGFSMGAGIQW